MLAMNCRYAGLCAGICSVLIAVLALIAQRRAQAITAAQIEADWLRQESLRNRPAQRVGKDVRPEDDAAGGCDGVKDGQFGFHTENEPEPWWQVDLGATADLGRLVLYNRCEPAIAARNGRVRVLVSDDAKAWRQIYQHDGTVFFGYTDKKPLEVTLAQCAARYLRLQLPGTSYFHFDEVEVYAVEGTANLALGKPATQSSTSQWSVRHAAPSPAGPPPTETVLARGRKLAEALERLGVNASESRAARERRVAARSAARRRDGRRAAAVAPRSALDRAADGAGQPAP